MQPERWTLREKWPECQRCELATLAVPERNAKDCGTFAQVLHSKTDASGFVAENITPVILDSQSKFNFTHIAAGATAVGKVRLEDCTSDT